MNDTIDYEHIIKRFNYKGQNIGDNWEIKTKINFMRVINSIRNARWDCYWINMADAQLRFGRKEKGALKGKVAGYIYHLMEADPHVYFANGSGFDDFSLAEELPSSFEHDITTVLPRNQTGSIREISRNPYWPDEITLEAKTADAEDDAYAENPGLGGRSSPRSTNLILYGPPGTGKTYATRERCVALIDGHAPTDRDELRFRYRTLENAGQIAFVTFHQSYGYEDFVEGLRPDTSGEGGQGPGLRLTAQSGVFRRIADLAENARLNARAVAGSAHLRHAEERFSLDGRKVFKMSLGRAGVEDEIYERAMEEGYAALGWGGAIDWSNPKFQDFETLAARWREQPGQENAHGGRGDIRQLWSFLNMDKGDLIVVSQGNSLFRAVGVVAGDYYFEPAAVDGYYHRRKVDWLVLPKALPVSEISEAAFTQTSCYNIGDARLKKTAIERLLSPYSHETGGADARPDQFVLVIDEINRANISKVFGELITLIEPDKRLGAEEELTVTLPYSREVFGVPSNLHIVGTMNTADRSIALLDTALRRRFEFEELMPRPELLRMCDGVDLPALLRAINRRIEYYLDREHQVGHAFFINCASKADVDAVMARKIIPLLCEYFFEDFGRVADVLGQTDRSTGFLDRVDLTERGQSRVSWRVKSPEAFELRAYRQAIGDFDTTTAIAKEPASDEVEA